MTRPDKSKCFLGASVSNLVKNWLHNLLFFYFAKSFYIFSSTNYSPVLILIIEQVWILLTLLRAGEKVLMVPNSEVQFYLMQQCIVSITNVIYAFFHSFCLLRKAVQPFCVIIVREHCFWAGLTMKVTFKSNIGDRWWQYSVRSWGTSTKCVTWEGKGWSQTCSSVPLSQKEVPVSRRDYQKYYHQIRNFDCPP